MSVNSGWGDWDEDREEAWKRSREHLSILAEYAGEHGLVLTMESLRPEESNLVTTVSDAKRMIDEVASPYLQPMVDTTAMGVAGETLEDWFATFGDGAIHEMHFIDGDPYGHLVWGDGKHDMDAFVATLNVHGFDGMLGQEITDGRYYDDPAAADAKNMAAFEKYLID
jgi:Sugar phosphate isomerases/epimerases